MVRGVVAAALVPWVVLALEPAAPKSVPPPPPAAPAAAAAVGGAGEHGLPALPSGDALDLVAPGWSRGVGTGGRVWPAAGALCRYLAAEDCARGKRVVELGCGTGAVGCYVAGGLAPASVVLTEGGSIALRAVAARNVDANARHFGDLSVRVAKHAWGDAQLLKTPADLVLGSDVTYDRDAHGDLCASVAGLLAATPDSVAVLAHQHRKLASLLSGEGQLAHFLEAAEAAALRVDEVKVDDRNPAAPVSILRITPR